MKKKTRYVILGLLRDNDLSGYEIKNQIEIKMFYFWQESYGQIYPELNAMDKEGLIKSVEEKDPDNRGKIRYRITERGRDVFNQWMSQEYEKDTVRSEALLKFFLADDNNIVDIIHHLERFHQQNNDYLQLYETFRDLMEPYKDKHNHQYILRMLDLGIRQQRLYCDWSSSYIEELKNI